MLINSEIQSIIKGSTTNISKRKKERKKRTLRLTIPNTNPFIFYVMHQTLLS